MKSGNSVALIAILLTSWALSSSADEPPTVGALVENMSWPQVTPTAEGMRAAKEKISQGMALQQALDHAAPDVGSPTQVGGGVANWLARDAEGNCVNLMIIGGDGKVNNVALSTLPRGSMGEAKCQNAGI